MNGRDGGGWGARDFGLFAAKIVPYVMITPSALRLCERCCGGAAICNYTAAFMYWSIRCCRGTSLSGSDKALCVKPITPIFVNLSCSSLAVRQRRRAKPIDGGKFHYAAVTKPFDRGRERGTVQSMAVNLVV